MDEIRYFFIVEALPPKVTEGDCSRRKVMGVCPQHDILWPELTAREHLEIFAELKGISGLRRETVSCFILSFLSLPC